MAIGSFIRSVTIVCVCVTEIVVNIVCVSSFSDGGILYVIVVDADGDGVSGWGIVDKIVEV